MTKFKQGRQHAKMQTNLSCAKKILKNLQKHATNSCKCVLFISYVCNLILKTYYYFIQQRWILLKSIRSLIGEGRQITKIVFAKKNSLKIKRRCINFFLYS